MKKLEEFLICKLKLSKMYKKNVVIVAGFLWLLSLFFFSCANRKEIVYFQADSTALHKSYGLSTTRLQPGDILTISVTADDIRATQPFNQVSSYQTGTLNNSNPFLPTYTIDGEGNINFPKLGKLKLAGLTRTEAIALMKERIGEFILNPGVSIEIRNFKVTVLGEVARPGNFNIENDRITILDAIGLAGDLTIYGKRDDILVIREQNGEKKEFRVNLTKRESLNSPVYYLAQNDVIYVEPNGARIQASKYTQNTSIFVSIASLIITIVAVVVR